MGVLANRGNLIRPKDGMQHGLGQQPDPSLPSTHKHTNTQTHNMQTHKHANTQTHNMQTHKYTTIKSWAAAWHWSQSDTILFSTHKNTNTCQHKNTHTDKRNTWKQKNTQTQKDLLQSGLGHPPDPSLPSTLPRSCTSGKTIFTRVFHPAQNFFHQILIFFTQVKTISPRAQKYFHQSSEIFSSRSKLLFKFGLNPFYPKTTHDLLPTMGFGAWSFLVSMKLIFFMELHQQSLQYHNITRGAFLRLFSQAELESVSGHPCQEFFLLYCPSAEL